MRSHLKALCVGTVLGFWTVPVQARAATGLDVNDVSILFPVAGDARTYPTLSLAEKSGASSLLTPALLEALLSFSTDEGHIGHPFEIWDFTSLDQWLIAGFRYDPCVPGTDPCQEELRIVAQPDNHKGMGDMALHLTYRLGTSPTAQSPALQAIVALKKKTAALSTVAMTTDGRPLGPHPILARLARSESQTVRDAGTQLYREFLGKFARPAALSSITVFGVHDGHEGDWNAMGDWVFINGHVTDGQWKPAPIANLGGAVSMRLQRRFQMAYNNETEVSPAPADTFLSTMPFYRTYSEDLRKSPARMQALAVAAHKIENPALTHRAGLDCLSCHSSTGLRIHPAFGALPSFIAGATAPIPPRITAFAEPRTLQFHQGYWNFRNFGYFDKSPSISMRTVNETAVSANRVNSLLGLTGPGRDCSAVQAKTLECMAKPSTQAPDAYTAQCLAACAP